MEIIKLLKRGDLASFKLAKALYNLSFKEFETLRRNIDAVEKILKAVSKEVKEKEKEKRKSLNISKENIKPLSSVGWKTAIKKLEKVEKLLEEGKISKAYIEVVSLRKGIEQKLKKEEEKKETLNSKEIQDLVNWYINLWKGEGKLPPEGYKLPEDKLRGYLYKMFERLTQTLTPEEIKELYGFWFDLTPETLPKEVKTNYVYKPLLIAKSGRDLQIFMKKVNLIVALREEIKEKMPIFKNYYTYD